MIRDERSNFSTFARTTSQAIGQERLFVISPQFFQSTLCPTGRGAGREGRGRKTVEREITSRGRNARGKRSHKEKREGEGRGAAAAVRDNA